MKHIGIYGGTFDPIHNGHLLTATAVQHFFEFEHFYFLPSNLPALKKHPTTTAKQRLDMLKLALISLPFKAEIDLTEIDRDGPSFMVDTLSLIRGKQGLKRSITLILGEDAFLQLPRWHRWEMILELSHLCILNRDSMPTVDLPPVLKTLLLNQETLAKEDLLTHSHGLIYRLNAGNFPISSTHIRAEIAKGKRVEDIPSQILDYILNNKLYIEETPCIKPEIN